MSLPHPTADVVKSIEGAIKWFQKSEIKGIQKEYFTNSDGKKDYRMVPVKTVLLFGHIFMIWKQTDLFSATVMALKNMISEIGLERRNGYSWYNKDGSKVLKRDMKNGKKR